MSETRGVKAVRWFFIVCGSIMIFSMCGVFPTLAERFLKWAMADWGISAWFDIMNYILIILWGILGLMFYGGVALLIALAIRLRITERKERNLWAD